MLVMQFKALITDCFREALDRKLFWLMIIISVAIAVWVGERRRACMAFPCRCWIERFLSAQRPKV